MFIWRRRFVYKNSFKNLIQFAICFCWIRLMLWSIENFYKSALNSLFGALKFVFNHRDFFMIQNAIFNKLLFNSYGFYVKILFCLWYFCDVFCFVFKWHSKISNYFYGIINLCDDKNHWQFESQFHWLVCQKLSKCHLGGPWIDGKEWIVGCSNRRRVCVSIVFCFNFRLFHVTVIDTFMIA